MNFFFKLGSKKVAAPCLFSVGIKAYVMEAFFNDCADVYMCLWDLQLLHNNQSIFDRYGEAQVLYNYAP